MKLTNTKLVTLQRLSAANTVWSPKTRSDQLNLNALWKLGFAHKQMGYPSGYVITPAGRNALDKERG